LNTKGLGEKCSNNLDCSQSFIAGGLPADAKITQVGCCGGKCSFRTLSRGSYVCNEQETDLFNKGGHRTVGIGEACSSDSHCSRTAFKGGYKADSETLVGCCAMGVGGTSITGTICSFRRRDNNGDYTCSEKCKGCEKTWEEKQFIPPALVPPANGQNGLITEGLGVKCSKDSDCSQSFAAGGLPADAETTIAGCCGGVCSMRTLSGKKYVCDTKKSRYSRTTYPTKGIGSECGDFNECSRTGLAGGYQSGNQSLVTCCGSEKYRGKKGKCSFLRIDSKGKYKCDIKGSASPEEIEYFRRQRESALQQYRPSTNMNTFMYNNTDQYRPSTNMNTFTYNNMDQYKPSTNMDTFMYNNMNQYGSIINYRCYYFSHLF